ncbi:MAG: Omp28-related outer membrane protein, partial [Candidatus Kapaibacterium sp.]
MSSLIACILLCTLFFQNLHAQNPARAMVIEDHTGAWCGWCVRGNQVAEDLHAQYGDRVIPLAFHNGDSMALPIQSVLAKKFSITGYPSGLVDRESFSIGSSTGRVLDPDNWAAAVKSLETAKSSIGVSVEWSIDSTTGVLTAKATAQMFADLNTQYAFNLVIVEDSVKGKGTGWDQTNYLSNRAGYESHPYYYMPSKIPDYYHMNVVRALEGGENGEVGGFPAFARKGESYSHTFTVDLDSVKLQNRKHLWVAVMVVENGGLNRIVNAVSSGKAPTPKSTLWKVDVTSTENYRMANRNDSTVFMLTLKNNNDKDVTGIVNMDRNYSYAPDDWTVRFEPKSIAVPAAGTATVKMIVKLGATAGYGNYKITTEIKPFENIRSLPLSTTVGVLSDGVRYAVARFDSDEGRELDPLMESYNKLSMYPAQSAVVACNDSTLKYYDFNAFDV